MHGAHGAWLIQYMWRVADFEQMYSCTMPVNFTIANSIGHWETGGPQAKVLKRKLGRELGCWIEQINKANAQVHVSCHQAPPHTLMKPLPGCLLVQWTLPTG
eukprot:1152903-Pelagomonas_calceolata.AAC.4